MESVRERRTKHGSLEKCTCAQQISQASILWLS
jgi:hypothetical protein